MEWRWQLNVNRGSSSSEMFSLMLNFFEFINICWSIKLHQGLSLALDAIEKVSKVIGTSKTLHFFWVCLCKRKTYFYHSKYGDLHRHKKGIQKHLKYHPSSLDIRDTWFWLLWRHTNNIYSMWICANMTHWQICMMIGGAYSWPWEVIMEPIDLIESLSSS